MNPDSDLAPSRTDADQQQLAQRREWRLALGDRAYLAETRENSHRPGLAAALIHERAMDAAQLARTHQPAERGTAPPARVGAER